MTCQANISPDVNDRAEEAGSGTFLCFGEILLRLSAPARELLVQSNGLELHVGGAEANVAVALASLGHQVQMISAVPRNQLGTRALSALMGCGLDCSRVIRREGRMGLYFSTSGAGHRPPEVLYDRENSTFAEAPAESFNWEEVMPGAAHLHLSGVTAALGRKSAEAVQTAAFAALRHGVRVSFDFNYRARLWDRQDYTPEAILRPLVEASSVLFASHWDICLVLGLDLPGDNSAQQRRVVEQAFEAFPRLECVASTQREICDTDRHRLSAKIDTREASHQTRTVELAGIVDRIGSGDAFAAGVLHGLAIGRPAAEALEAGLALSSLKHSLPGDFSRFDQSDLAAFGLGQRDVRR